MPTAVPKRIWIWDSSLLSSEEIKKIKEIIIWKSGSVVWEVSLLVTYFKELVEELFSWKENEIEAKLKSLSESEDIQVIDSQEISQLVLVYNQTLVKVFNTNEKNFIGKENWKYSESISSARVVKKLIQESISKIIFEVVKDNWLQYLSIDWKSLRLKFWKKKWESKNFPLSKFWTKSEKMREALEKRKRINDSRTNEKNTKTYREELNKAYKRLVERKIIEEFSIIKKYKKDWMFYVDQEVFDRIKYLKIRKGWNWRFNLEFRRKDYSICRSIHHHHENCRWWISNWNVQDGNAFDQVLSGLINYYKDIDIIFTPLEIQILKSFSNLVLYYDDNQEKIKA